MKILFTLPCLLFGIFVHPILLYAGTNITVPFSSTFDCPESAQSSWGSMDDIAGCPGWQGFGSWTTSAGSGDRISSQDNNPSGGGGRGFGAAVGDGHNNSGGRIIASFAEQPELWVRFYMKYPAGFSWVNGEPEWQKILRFRGPTNSDVVFQFRDWTDAELSFYLPGTISTNVGGSCGWTCIMGGSTGDSVWHLYEIHVKRGNPGILEAWVDGNRIFINTTTHVADSGFTNLEIIDNQNAPNNGGDRYISVDDIAISTTGYIGPIGGGSDTNPPTVSLTAPANDATVSGTTTVSATASDNSGTVSGVQFRLDGANLGAEDTTSPFSTSWNTTTATNGSHTLTAIARDPSGNTATSSSVSVTVNNGTSAPTFTFTANPTSITSGGSSTLTWSAVTNATSCTATGGTFTGSKSTSGGTQSVSPTSTTTYTLSCTGAGGTTNQTATVTVSGGTGTTFFSEGYENTSFASRGWYDITTGTVDTAEHHSGISSLRCTYNAGANNCTAPSRHKFTDSNSAYISYWVKYSANFVGSGVGYHPHEMYLLTNLNGDYDGLAFDYLTMYLESHWSGSSNGYMQAGFQDGQNIDQTRLNQNLIGVTENRAVAGCNGSPSGYSGDCYDRGDGVYVNGTVLGTPQTFTTANKNTWNHVEAFYQLNSISNGIGQADGILRIWFNDALVFERTNAILRTGAQPNMRFNQFIFGPWIGDGSPVTQTMWLDDLEVRDSRPGTSVTPVTCNTVTTSNFSQSAYNAYGAPYDLFASNAQLVDARCTASDTHTIQATIGKANDTTRIVYRRGYYFDPGINNWAQYTATCTGTLNGDWCAGPTTATIIDPDISTASSGTPAYFVGMVCSVQGGGWKCGCRDTTCSNFYWQIQGAGM